MAHGVCAQMNGLSSSKNFVPLLKTLNNETPPSTARRSRAQKGKRSSDAKEDRREVDELTTEGKSTN